MSGIYFSFQMAVEMFDYLDDVIALQATSKFSDLLNIVYVVLIKNVLVFSSITTFHVNSMTLAGQCRLSPLIPLIQDSNQLYDFLVRIMFKLHGNLPNDVLQGKNGINEKYFSTINNIVLYRSPGPISSNIYPNEIVLQSVQESAIFRQFNNSSEVTRKSTKFQFSS